MNPKQHSTLDVTLAGVCRSCPVCRTARRHQAGFAYWLVNRVERSLCPFCRAYERVYGRKAHEAGAAHQTQSDT